MGTCDLFNTLSIPWKREKLIVLSNLFPRKHHLAGTLPGPLVYAIGGENQWANDDLFPSEPPNKWLVDLSSLTRGR